MNEEKKKILKERQCPEGEGFVTDCLGDELDNFPMCNSKHCCFHCDSPVRLSLKMAMRLLDRSGHNRMPTKLVPTQRIIPAFEGQESNSLRYTRKKK